MVTFKDSLKKWFYTNSSSAASSNARIPLLTATGEPKGSDTMANIASTLGVGGITDSCYFKPYALPANGSVRILNTPRLSPSEFSNTIFALIAHHWGGTSFVDVLVSHSGNLRTTTIVGTRPSMFSYVYGNAWVELANSDSSAHTVHLSILIFGGTIE